MDTSILIAEDDADIRDLLRLYLEGEGFQVLEAGDGASALRLAREQSPSMAILDIMMPEMNGLDAARAIRAMDRPDAGTIPIIAMTANAFAEDERQALACGMNAHVAKPIDVHALERVVAELS